jgi:hypothetical protein
MILNSKNLNIKIHDDINQTDYRNLQAVVFSKSKSINHTGFYNNTALYYGGALVIENSEVYLSMSEFFDNKAGKRGGAIFYYVSYEY